MKLIEIGKKLYKQNPAVLNTLLSIYNHLPFNNKFKGFSQNHICIKGSYLKNTAIRINGVNNRVILGENCLLKNTSICISGDNNVIELGSKVYCQSAELHIEDSNGTLSIGNNTTITGKTHLALIEGKKIQIGANCLFSSNIALRVGDSHSILDLDGKRINPSKDIIIGEHVWIGNDVKINKGVSISPNSIIGTGAIVTNSFIDENVVLAGVPAKIVKKNINWCNERIPL